MSKVIEKEPVVGKPGGGLPFFEWFVAKYFLFPAIYKSTSLEEAKRLFEIERDKILNLVSGIDNEHAQSRVLIPRLRGLEDNSRYWSCAMVIEHLDIVGCGITDIILGLTSGGIKKDPVLIQDVKPNPAVSLDKAISGFDKTADRFLRDIELSQIDNHPSVKFAHPWFGPMNARQWYILAGRHQAVHRQQIKAILEKINAH